MLALMRVYSQVPPGQMIPLTDSHGQNPPRGHMPPSGQQPPPGHMPASGQTPLLLVRETSIFSQHNTRPAKLRPIFWSETGMT